MKYNQNNININSFLSSLTNNKHNNNTHIGSNHNNYNNYNYKGKYT